MDLLNSHPYLQSYEKGRWHYGGFERSDHLECCAGPPVLSPIRFSWPNCLGGNTEYRF